MIGLHCIDEILDQSKDYDWKLIEKKIVFAESNQQCTVALFGKGCIAAQTGCVF